MMMGLYFALGIFLLAAARNPPLHRSLIAFAAWSSFAHAAVMSTLGLEIPSERSGFLVSSGMLVLIGVVLIALAPSKQSAQQASAWGHAAKQDLRAQRPVRSSGPSFTPTGRAECKTSRTSLWITASLFCPLSAGESRNTCGKPTP
jgi:hypothetical protein